MKSELTPYLNFRGTTREAMELYARVFGGTPEIATYKDLGMSQDPADDDKVMHAVLHADDGLRIMAADYPESMEYVAGTNFSLALSGDDEARLRGWFDALAEGGTVLMPLQPVPWGDTFGTVTDRFGVRWMVDIAASG